MRNGQLFKLLLECMVLAAAKAIVEMKGTLRLLIHTPAKHADHGCDANATADQDGGRGTVRVAP